MRSVLKKKTRTVAEKARERATKGKKGQNSLEKIPNEEINHTRVKIGLRRAWSRSPIIGKWATCQHMEFAAEEKDGVSGGGWLSDFRVL